MLIFHIFQTLKLHKHFKVLSEANVHEVLHGECQSMMNDAPRSRTRYPRDEDDNLIENNGKQ